VSEDPMSPDEPNRKMEGYFFKGLAAVVNPDQQSSGVGDFPQTIVDYYKGFLSAGCDREDALDLTTRFWERVLREYRT
jgi:hypothetical protein